MAVIFDDTNTTFDSGSVQFGGGVPTVDTTPAKIRTIVPLKGTVTDLGPTFDSTYSFDSLIVDFDGNRTTGDQSIKPSIREVI